MESPPLQAVRVSPPHSLPVLAAQVAEECTLRGHTGAVASVAFVESGSQDPEAKDALPPGQVLSGSWDHSLRLWDSSAQACTHTMVSGMRRGNAPSSVLGCLVSAVWRPTCHQR